VARAFPFGINRSCFGRIVAIIHVRRLDFVHCVRIDAGIWRSGFRFVDRFRKKPWKLGLLFTGLAKSHFY